MCTFTPVSPFGYDAVWAYVLMLNRSIEVLKTRVFKDGSKRKLEDFRYDDHEMMLVFSDLMNQTDFVGLTVIRLFTVLYCLAHKFFECFIIHQY